MYTLTERLYKNNVLLSYYGFFDNSVLEQVLQITRKKMEDLDEEPGVMDKVNGAINDCMNNIMANNFFTEDAFLKYKSLLLVSYHNGAYTIDTISVVNAEQKKSIHKQLTFLDSKTKDELGDLRVQIQRNDRHPLHSGVGLGLVELMLESNNCHYRFKDYDDLNFLFNINFEISRAN